MGHINANTNLGEIRVSEFDEASSAGHHVCLEKRTEKLASSEITKKVIVSGE